MKKRILAWLCCLVMVISGLWIAPAQTAEAADGTISIVAPEARFQINGGYVNLEYSGMSSDYASHNGNFLTKEFIDAGWVELNGLTEADVLEGQVFTGLATNNVLQLNWDNRKAAFPAGSSIVLKSGAPITYKTTSDAVATVYLDAEYTIKFEETDNAENYYNIVRVSKEAVGGKISFTSTGSEFNIDRTYNYNFINIGISEIADFGSAVSGTVNVDYVNAGWITFDGMTWDDLAFGMRRGRIEISNVIQLCYDMRESGLPIGASFTWKKGAPLYYVNKSGVTTRVTLDANYVFTVKESASENAHCAFSIEKQVVPENKGTASITSVSPSFEIDTTYDYNFINFNFTQVEDWAGRMEQGYVDADYVADGYLSFDGGLTADEFFRGLRSGRAETDCIFQLCYDTRDAGFPVGSSFTFKKGAPIYYKNTEGGISYVELDANYKFTCVAGSEGTKHNTFSVTKELVPEYQGEVGITSEGVSFVIEPTYNYMNIVFGPALSDFASCVDYGYMGAEYIADGHLVVEGMSEEVFLQGMRVGRIEINEIIQISYEPREAGFPEGASITFKKGAPLYYKNTEGGLSYVALDADYKITFRAPESENSHNASTVKKLICSVVGHEEETIPGTEPTCSEPGLTEGSVCSECGEILVEQEEVEPVAHTTVHFEAIEPSCHYNGRVEYWFCSGCEGFWEDAACTRVTNSTDVILEKVDHKKEKLPAVAAQVGKTGLTEGSKCSVCNKVLEPQKTIAAKQLAAPKASKVTKATGGKKKITVKFKKVSGVTRYEIQIATKKNMKKGLKTIKVTKSKDMKNAKYVINKLNAKKTYYVRICTVKTVNGVTKKSSWSKVVKVKTK